MNSIKTNNKISVMHKAVKEILSDDEALQSIVTTTQAVMPNAKYVLNDVEAMLRFYSMVNINHAEKTPKQDNGILTSKDVGRKEPKHNLSAEELQDKFEVIAHLLKEVVISVGYEEFSEVIGMSSSHIEAIFQEIDANDFPSATKAGREYNNDKFKTAELIIDTTTQSFDDLGVDSAINNILRNVAHKIHVIDSWDGKPIDVEDVNGNQVGVFQLLSERTKFDRVREGIFQINIDLDHPSFELFSKTDSIRAYPNSISNALMLIEEKKSVNEASQYQQQVIAVRGNISPTETTSWTVGGYGGFIHIETNHSFTSKRQNLKDNTSTVDASL